MSIQSVKDSLHNGRVVRVLRTDVRFDCYGIVDEEVLTYETSGKILVKLGADQEFDTLYDFSANIGDHWRFIVDCYEPSRFVEFRVTDTSSILINTERRRVFQYAIIDSLWPCTELLRDTIEVIEGIGYPEYLLPFWGTVCDGDYVDGLRCYEDPILGLYKYDPTIDQCDIITSIPEVEASQPLQLFPNPTNDILYVSLAIEGDHYYELIDIQGRLIRTGQLTDVQIQVGDLNSGVYMLRVKAKELIFVKHFVKI